MAKYISSLENLVIQVLSNGSEMETKARNGDPSACFQLGMKYLLGIGTSIDFKNASKYLGSQSLVNDPDSNRLLGFIEECNGNYSQAFQYYSKAADKESTSIFYRKVYDQRENLKIFFNGLGLPVRVLNNVISSTLYDFLKGTQGASFKLALICQDEFSCIEAAKSCYMSEEYSSALAWLVKGNVDSKNQMFDGIREKSNELFRKLNDAESIQVIEVEGNCFISESDISTLFGKVMEALTEIKAICNKIWVTKTEKVVINYSNRFAKEENARKESERLEKETWKEKRRLEEEARKDQLIKTIVYTVAFLFWFIICLIGGADDKDVNFLELIGYSAFGGVLLGILPIYIFANYKKNKN